MPLRRKLVWIALLYFAEGLPFGIIKEVVPVYFKVSGLSLTSIGLASLLGLPWTLKVLWSPLVDRFGERRAWITTCLAALALCTAAVPWFDPAALGLGLWAVLLGITMASATQDIAIDAYTITLVDPGEEGDANGVRVSAARVALIASGGGLVLLAPWIGWRAVFTAGGAMLAVLAAVSWRAPRLVVPLESRRHGLAAMRRWLLRPRVWAVFLFVFGYKLCDAAMGPMVKPFWIDRGLGVAEIGLVSTTVGVFATIAGALVGGRLTSRWGILRALLLLGLVQALSNLGYAAVAWWDPPFPQTDVRTLGDLLPALAQPGRAFIYAASVTESFTGGLGTAAFLAFLMHICEKEHAAVQYALLSAIFGLSRDLTGAASGWATTQIGYGPYFTATFFLVFPALALLPLVRPWIHDRNAPAGLPA